METILIVEDVAPIRNLLVRALRREAVRVLSASSYLEAEEILSTEDSLSLVLTDLVLSEESEAEGLGVISSVRERFPDAAVVVMSGYPTTRMRAEAASRGAAGFLVKPFTLHELEAALTAHGVGLNFR